MIALVYSISPTYERRTASDILQDVSLLLFKIEWNIQPPCVSWCRKEEWVYFDPHIRLNETQCDELSGLPHSAMLESVMLAAFCEQSFRILFFSFVPALFHLHLLGTFCKVGSELSAVSTVGVRANNEWTGDTDGETGYQIIITQENSQCWGLREMLLPWAVGVSRGCHRKWELS